MYTVVKLTYYAIQYLKFVFLDSNIYQQATKSQNYGLAPQGSHAVKLRHVNLSLEFSLFLSTLSQLSALSQVLQPSLRSLRSLLGPSGLS